jgi:hypothetical protein
MSGPTVRSAVEHLSNILRRYESGDLDRYNYDDIAGTINSLEAFQNANSTDDDLYTLCGLVSSITSYLYVARGYATPNVPRDLQYYQSFNAVRRLIQQVNRVK